MDVKHEDDGKKGRFHIKTGGKELAEMTYVWAGDDRFIIDHTFVDDRLKGQKIGYQLLEHAVSMAREKKLSIIPLCPFAKAAIDKRADLQDVLVH